MDAGESEYSGGCEAGAVCSGGELVAASEVQASEVQAPEVQAPEVQAPEVQASEVQRKVDWMNPGYSCRCRNCGERTPPRTPVRRCTVHQRSRVVRILAAQGHWSAAVQMMELSVTPETVRALIEQAVEEGRWGWVRAVVKTGQCCGELGEWLCQHAVDRKQWDTAMQLLDMGVQPALRDSLLQSALLQHHVPCTAKLIQLGVRKSYREKGIRKEMAKGYGDFVLQVVKTVQDPDLTDFVLQESVRQKQLQLVSELVNNVELFVTQLDIVCDSTAVCQLQTVPLHLLPDVVIPRNWMVDKLCQSNLAQAFVDLYPDDCVPDALRRVLLMSSIRHGQADFFVHLLQRESVSDSELIEAIKYAIRMLDKDTLFHIVDSDYGFAKVYFEEFYI